VLAASPLLLAAVEPQAVSKDPNTEKHNSIAIAFFFIIFLLF
jgi:hypothetical protein